MRLNSADLQMSAGGGVQFIVMSTLHIVVVQVHAFDEWRATAKHHSTFGNMPAAVAPAP